MINSFELKSIWIEIDLAQTVIVSVTVYEIRYVCVWVSVLFCRTSRALILTESDGVANTWKSSNYISMYIYIEYIHIYIYIYMYTEFYFWVPRNKILKILAWVVVWSDLSRTKFEVFMSVHIDMYWHRDIQVSRIDPGAGNIL